MYLKYIVKVGFKELFFDVLILVLMVVIAAFAYIPVGLVQDLVRSLIITFVPLTGIAFSLFDWLFALIKAVCALLLFMYLFNMRYDFKNDKVVPIEGSYTLERKDSIFAPDEDTKKEVPVEEKDLDLPKEKEE
jgi:hypothetical protein